MYDKLIPELRYDPANIGYSTMTDQQALDALKAATVERIRSSMSGQELFVNTVPAEFSVLTAHKQILWISFCSGGSIDPGHVVTVDFVKWIFGTASATVTALAAARMETVSRMVYLELGEVQIGNITGARQLIAGEN